MADDDARTPVAAAIASAQERLQEALAALAGLPLVDAAALRFTQHALANYLTVTSATVDLLLDDIGPTAAPQSLTWLHNLRHVTDLMAHTVRRFGAAATLEPQHLVWEAVDLVLGAERVCAYYRRQAERKQLTLVVEAQAGVPHAWTDRIAMATVLSDLVSNAVRCAPPGTTMRVRLTSDGATVTCRVEDEGPGVSVAEQAQLFQRGARLSRPTTGGEPRSGSDLAVAKELVEVVGGDIWYEDAPGHGACFAFRLPAAGPQGQGAGR